MSEINNPPAFPTGIDKQGLSQFTGMTLRDWFAGQVLLEFTTLVTVTNPKTLNVVARLSYDMADAMLAERGK